MTTAGQRGDQYAVVRAPIITKTLLAGSGRELVDTLQHCMVDTSGRDKLVVLLETLPPRGARPR